MPSKWKLEVREIKDAKNTLRQIALAADPATSSSALSSIFKLALKEVQDGLRESGVMMRDQARSNAAATRAPRRLYAGPRPAIFAFSDFDAARDDKRKRSVLVGVRTGLARQVRDIDLYIFWSPKSNRRHRDNSKLRYRWRGMFFDGGLSVSFGALFERGTMGGRIRPRWYFRNALAQTKSRILRNIGQSYLRAVKIINDAK